MYSNIFVNIISDKIPWSIDGKILFFLDASMKIYLFYLLLELPNIAHKYQHKDQ